jgi:hypothetical protein
MLPSTEPFLVCDIVGSSRCDYIDFLAVEEVSYL